MVGIARSVDAMHRDGSTFSTEIQVTEQINKEGIKIFIGRLRHRKIEERIEKGMNLFNLRFILSDIVARYIVNTKALGTAISNMSGDQSNAQSAVSMTSDGTKRINFKGKKASAKGSRSQGSSLVSRNAASEVHSIHDDNDEHSILSSSLNGSSHGSNGTSSLSSNTKFLNLLAKLKFIKNTNKEDPSTTRLGIMTHFILAGYVIFFIIGLIVTNVIPSPIPYYELLNVLLNTDKVINSVVLASRLLQLEKDPSIIISYCSWSKEHSSDWHSNATYTSSSHGSAAHRKRAEVLKPLCPWIKSAYISREYRATLPAELRTDDTYTQLPIEEMLPEYVHELKYSSNEFKSMYAKIRKPGDTFDQQINGEIELLQFVNGTANIPSKVTLMTFFNVMGTLADATATLSQNQDLGPSSIRSWNLIRGNRYRISDFVASMAYMIPDQSRTAINNNMIFHFIMALVSIALSIVSFCVSKNNMSKGGFCIFAGSSYSCCSVRSRTHFASYSAYPQINGVRSCAQRVFDL